MTDRDVLERVKNAVGGAVTGLPRREDHHKDVWLWRVSIIEATPLVKRMIPLLGQRRRSRAEEFIELRNLVIQRQSAKSRIFSERRNKIWELFQSGSKHHEIASELKMDRGTVTKIINKMKMESSHSPA